MGNLKKKKATTKKKKKHTAGVCWQGNVMETLKGCLGDLVQKGIDSSRSQGDSQVGASGLTLTSSPVKEKKHREVARINGG